MHKCNQKQPTSTLLYDHQMTVTFFYIFKICSQQGMCRSEVRYCALQVEGD